MLFPWVNPQTTFFQDRKMISFQDETNAQLHL
jgi:hypothetical protein